MQKKSEKDANVIRWLKEVLKKFSTVSIILQKNLPQVKWNLCPAMKSFSLPFQLEKQSNRTTSWSKQIPTTLFPNYFISWPKEWRIILSATLENNSHITRIPGHLSRLHLKITAAQFRCTWIISSADYTCPFPDYKSRCCRKEETVRTPKGKTCTWAR